MKRPPSVSRILSVATAILLLTSCSSGSSSLDAENNGDELLGSTECITVLGLNQALEMKYKSGRLEIVVTGGSVVVSGGVSVRWCAPESHPEDSTQQEDNYDSDNSPTEDSTQQESDYDSDNSPIAPVRTEYLPSLECMNRTGSFELLRDGRSNMKCHYTLKDGSQGEPKPVLNGRQGSVVATTTMMPTDGPPDTAGSSVCFGLFEDGQVVVASQLMPYGDECADHFLGNTKPIPFASDLRCPSSGDLTILESNGGDSTNRCVAIFADGSNRVKPVNEVLHLSTGDYGAYDPDVPIVKFRFFRDTRFNARLCLVMNRNGAIRSFIAGEEATTCL